MIKMKKIINQSFSFFLISGLGWIIDFTIYTILTKVINLEVFISNIISSIPAITFVFIFSTRKIFKKNISKISIKNKYLIYVVYQMILLFIISKFGQFLFDSTSYLMKEILFIFNNYKIVIKIIITPFTMILNYIMMKLVVEKM
jgi:putative flippase GtrA